MNNYFKNRESGSTLKEKKEYVLHWLENNLYPNSDFNTNLNNATSMSLTKINSKYESSLVFPSSPKLGHKDLAPFTHPTSPILSGKRSTSFKIKKSRKIPKKIKIARKLSTTNINKNEQNLLFESNCDISLPKLISNYDGKFEIFSTTEYINSINNGSLLKDINSINFSKTSTVEEEITSQFIESVSSENESIEGTEINVQEINSDTDKTVSDLIEDISTQAILDNFKENQNSISENIQNTLSILSESTNNIHVSKSVIIEINESQKDVEKFTPVDQIDSTSTLKSKIDFSKTSYILQYKSEKQKRKKNPKKGSLSDILYIRMGKEKSNVNLLRHQLYKKPDSIMIKPFILLQIIEHLPMINENQLLKCLMIEDTMNLLNGLLKKQGHHFITVMNVPQISCLINTNQKPILKIYEPWTVVDRDQLFLLITRFIAIPTYITEEDISDNTNIKNFKITQEFDCPCMYDKMLSNKCTFKLQNNLHNIIKVIFNYK